MEIIPQSAVMKSFHHNNVQAKKKHKVNTVKRIGNRFLTDRKSQTTLKYEFS